MPPKGRRADAASSAPLTDELCAAIDRYCARTRPDRANRWNASGIARAIGANRDAVTAYLAEHAERLHAERNAYTAALHGAFTAAQAGLEAQGRNKGEAMAFAEWEQARTVALLSLRLRDESARADGVKELALCARTLADLAATVERLSDSVGDGVEMDEPVLRVLERIREAVQGAGPNSDVLCGVVDEGGARLPS